MNRIKLSVFSLLIASTLFMGCHSRSSAGSNDDTSVSKITLTTDQAIGDTIWVWVEADSTAKDDIWIDLNNNGNKEENENIVGFGGNYYPYIVKSRTITLFGDITEFGCVYSKLLSLDVSRAPSLSMLDFSNNRVKELDISHNPNLIGLWCSNNQLTTLAISDIVRNLPDCLPGDGATARFEGNHDLPARKEVIWAREMGWDIVAPQIILTTSKAVGQEIELAAAANEEDRNNVWVDLNNNGIRERGEEFDNLTRSASSSNFVIGSLIITVYGKVTYLGCTDNELTSIEIRNSPKLNELWCSNNQLTELDVTEAPMLKELWCEDNQLTEAAISRIVEDLPTRIESDYASAYFNNNPARASKEDSVIASAKQWEIGPIQLSAEAQAKYDALFQAWKPFLGKWTLDGESGCIGECFHLSFNLAGNGGGVYFSIYYYDGGPFEESYTGKIVAENHAELYLENVGGSISFEKAVGPSKLKNKGKKVADCIIQPDGSMKVTIVKNVSRNMRENNVLLKVKEEK